MQFPKLPIDLAGEAISFQVIDVELPAFVDADQGDQVASFLAAFAKTHGRDLASLDYVFCSDEELLRMNVEHLRHDTYTDIITFDLSDGADPELADLPFKIGLSSTGSIDSNDDSASLPAIEGECYISIDRVNDNAAGFGESPDIELLRVLVHGLLHLCGLGDKTEAEIIAMRQAEQNALDEWRTSWAAE